VRLVLAERKAVVATTRDLDLTVLHKWAPRTQVHRSMGQMLSTPFVAKQWPNVLVRQVAANSRICTGSDTTEFVIDSDRHPASARVRRVL
jgi:hypothetical protein